MVKDIDNPYFMSINTPNVRSFVFRGDIHLIYLENVPLLFNVLYEPKELVIEETNYFYNNFLSIIVLEYFS